MEKNSILSGFIVLDQQRVDELEADLWQMEHQKSGARLVWLERAEENKTFAIAFQTQPWDDTGVFHILEHSVLCGSKRYPVKEPFVELMKSSMNTFLNAMTFPDRTVYPVSSRNGQDFINLLRVYMDAVLHPLLHSKPEIFGQEGWHYELGEDGALSVKGVVYNEMKGAFSSPDALLEREAARRLFPDTCYRYVFGGDPAHIPELTYEAFAAAHSRLYHPSNSYIFLDGSVDIAQVLEILDSEYLCAYERCPTPEGIPLQKPVEAGLSAIRYELSAQESLEGRARLADGYAVCTFRDRETLMALQALSDVLCGDNQAPLKRRLLESGLAQDVRLELHDGVQQPWLLLEARDIAEDKSEEVSSALRDELERLSREGLDHRRVLAALDNLEFEARQRDYGQMPQGLMLCFQVMESWLYGGDPAANLSVGTLFDGLRDKCGTGYFEELLKQLILENPHHCRILALPSHTIGQERQAQETARLSAVRSSWGTEEAAGVHRFQEAIAAWQNMPDTPEQLASIPRLRLDQIPAEPEKLPIEEETADSIALLRHRLPTNGITYCNLYFALDDLSPEELAKASFMAQLFGCLDTAKYSLADLSREMRSLFGNIWFTVEAYGRQNAPDRCRTFLCVSCSILDAKLEKALSLLTELLVGQQWENSQQALTFLRQRRAAMAEQMVTAGHSAAMSRVLACSTAEGAVQEQASGITFLRWLTELEQNFPARFPALAQDLISLAQRIFCRARMTVSVTAGNEASAKTVTRLLSSSLPQGSFALPCTGAVLPWEPRLEGFVIPSGVSYAALGGVFQGAGSGSAKVMGRTVSLAHLWNTVRVQGGAYGTGMVLRDTGFAGFYSFRDPSAARTLDCYRASSDFLRGIDIDLTGMITGAAAESDPLLTARMKGRMADALYWRQISHEDRCRVRREMLAAVPEDLKALAGPVEDLTARGSICVLGSRQQVDACAGWLDNIVVL